MRLEYTLTSDDLRESLRLPQQSRDLVWGVLVGWSALLALAVPIAAGWMGEEPPATLAAAQAAPPQDLWATLAPSLVGLTLVVGGTVVGRRHLARHGVFVPGGGSTRTTPIAGLVLLIAAFAWMVLPNVPGLAVAWHPTLRRQLWAAVAPWFAYGVHVGVVRLTGARHAAAQLMAHVRSLARPTSADLSDEGITTANGVVEARIAWSYFVSYGETAHLLLIATDDGAPLILPKRAVIDPADLRRLRSLIKAHVSAGRFLPPLATSPVGPAL